MLDEDCFCPVEDLNALEEGQGAVLLIATPGRLQSHVPWLGRKNPRTLSGTSYLAGFVCPFSRMIEKLMFLVKFGVLPKEYTIFNLYMDEMAPNKASEIFG